MSNIKPNFHYETVVTADGSPTLRFEGGEHMHSLDGAYSETGHVYYFPFMGGVNLPGDSALLSLGLGLGYVEIMTASILLESDHHPCPLHTYESDPWLCDQFTRWLQGKQCDLHEAFEVILARYAIDHGLKAVAIKKYLLEMYQKQLFQICGPMTIDSTTSTKFTGIAFDAFSSRTSPQLWTPEFLDHFLTEFAAETCFLATYAATGNLNRALEKHGFGINKQPGFGRKREMTTAIR